MQEQRYCIKKMLRKVIKAVYRKRGIIVIVYGICQEEDKPQMSIRKN